jgi:hypothetical protein
VRRGEKVAEEGLELIVARGCHDEVCDKVPTTGGAESGALGATDERIAEIVASLPHLPNTALDLLVQTVRAFRK